MNNYDTLVLNASYQALDKISWQDAFINIYQGKARAIEYYDEVVRSPNDEYYVPAVIVLTEYTGQPVRRNLYSKRLVLERDKFICQYCRRKLTATTATIDHVLPRSKGGKSTFVNTVASCEPCNTRKADHFLWATRMKLIREPKKPYIHPLRGKITNPPPEWKEHLVGIL